MLAKTKEGKRQELKDKLWRLDGEFVIMPFQHYHRFGPDCTCMKCLMKFDGMLTRFSRSVSKRRKKKKP